MADDDNDEYQQAFVQVDDTTLIAAIRQREADVTPLLKPMGGNVVQALQLSLRDPPYQTRTDSVKNMSFDVVLKVLNTVKDAEIANVVGALTMEECDVLMKYIYRGLGPAGKKNETYSKLLHWHPEVLKRAGPSSIMRAISEVSLAL